MIRAAGLTGTFILRVGLGVVLLWAGSAKISEPGLFAQTIRAYDVLPLAAVNPFAVLVPWMEVAAGACLVAGLWVRGSALLSLSLLSSFGIALVVNVYRGSDISCGCFALDGTGGSLEGALVRDVVLMAAGAVLAIVPGAPPLSVDSLLGRRRTRAVLAKESCAD